MKFFFLLLISGCSLFFGNDRSPETAKHKHYSVHFQAPDWKVVPDDTSDYVFRNEVDGRILLSNSFCDDYQDQTLEVLATKTFNSLSEFLDLTGEDLEFHGRRAYRVRGHGFLDGVKVNLQLLNTRRNNCYYDFLAIDPFTRAPTHLSDFDVFLESVVFR